MTDTTLPRTGTEIVLPSPGEPTRRGPLPLVASIVPIAGAVVMWLVTGYVIMLLFAALGPLMAIAALADGARVRRRERRTAARELDEACERAEAEISRRHDAERSLLEAARPDVVALASERAPWTRGSDELVLGLGPVESAVRVTGGTGERADALRERAQRIAGAPVAVPSAGGVCVQGEPVLARAVARSLLLQLCLRSGPGEVAVTAVPADEEVAFAALPHRRSPAPVRAALVWGAASAAGADIVIAAIGPGEPVPVGCARVLELRPERPLAGRLLGAASGAEAEELAAEAMSARQARELCEAMAGRVSGGVPGRMALGELADPPAPGHGLAAVIGRGADGDVVVDLVADGPHAVVVGMTGAGKSELLTTWVASLARRWGPDRITFLLADFKGGTAFEALTGLPQVAGVVTDLDGPGARRAVESLRAELRRREAELARAGARDVSDPRVAMSRLVIVVDEFAALLQEHGDLSAVFTDIAARGRALGMHLILGTQRAAGVFRESLLANCPLRIALRVADPSDSRLIVGTDGAAAIPGDASSRGIALVRRAADAAPVLCRIARTSAADLAPAAPTVSTAPAPWLPPLPEMLPLSRLREGSERRGIVLGLADEPERQRQETVVLRPGAERGIAVIGAAGTGKSTAVTLVLAQAGAGEALVVPPDPEAAWDAIEQAMRSAPAIVAIDDVDALVARFPAEYAGEVLARIETIVRDAGARGSMVLCTAARAAGPVARLLDLLPRRVILPLPSRADHVAAGGDGAGFVAGRVPGRAVLDGRDVQLAWPGEAPEHAPDTARRDAVWHPVAPATGLVVRGGASRAAQLADAWGRGARVVSLDGLEPGTRLDDLAGQVPVVIAGDGDAWLRHGALLRDVRSTGELLFGAECAAELRTIAGERELPPYARPRASRAWRVAGAGIERVVLP